MRSGEKRSRQPDPGLPVAGSLSIVVAAAIMIAVGLIAAYLPARRAMRASIPWSR
jgi:ABC-type antimicrobial peptide transport system permease subunit